MIKFPPTLAQRCFFVSSWWCSFINSSVFVAEEVRRFLAETNSPLSLSDKLLNFWGEKTLNKLNTNWAAPALPLHRKHCRPRFQCIMPELKKIFTTSLQRLASHMVSWQQKRSWLWLNNDTPYNMKLAEGSIWVWQGGESGVEKSESGVEKVKVVLQFSGRFPFHFNRIQIFSHFIFVGNKMNTSR